MKNAPHVGAGRGAGDIDSASAVAPLPFHLLTIERVDFGSKQATGSIEISGFATLIEFDYFEPAGKPSFVAAKSVRSKYGGAYERTVTFAPEFAAALLAAVEDALANGKVDR